MAEATTRPPTATAADFLARVADPARRADAETKRAAKPKPKKKSVAAKR